MSQDFICQTNLFFKGSWVFLYKQHTYISTPFTQKTITPRILWCVPLFFKTYIHMILYFHKDFWEIKLLIQNRNQTYVCSNKQVLEIQVLS
jgi:hypothetical protein